jgi:hypothetical protein
MFKLAFQAAPWPNPPVPLVVALLPTLRHALRWTALHTGLPVAVVAAIALVVSFRLARKIGRLCIEVAVVSTVLLALTRLGWISW